MADKLISIDTTKSAGSQLPASVKSEVQVVAKGAVTANDVGLGSVNNTADSAKPVSTAQAAADASVLSQALTAAAAASTTVDLGFSQPEIGPGTYLDFGTTNINKVLQAIVDAGGKRVRIAAWWGSLQATVGGTVSWTGLDQAVNLAVSYGIKPLLMITSPAPASGTPTAAAFATLCGQIAARYGAAGTNVVHDYEVWNEPNHVNSAVPFDGTAATFATVLSAAHDAIHAADTAANVIFGGLSAEPTVSGIGTLGSDFLQGVLDAGAGAKFDALAYHWYSHNTALTAWEQPSRTQAFFADMALCRTKLIGAGMSAKKIWVTEFGFSSIQVASPVTLAQWMGQQIDLLHNTPWVGPMFIHQLRDPKTDDATVPADAYGILDNAFNPKQPLRDTVAAVNNPNKANTPPGSITQTQLAITGTPTSTTFVKANADGTFTAADPPSGGGGGGTAPHIEYIGDGSTTEFDVTHGFSTTALEVVVQYNDSSHGQVVVSPTYPTKDTVHLSFRVPPTTNQFSVTVYKLGQSDVTAPTKPTLTLNGTPGTTTIGVTASGSTDDSGLALRYVYVLDSTRINSTPTSATTFTYTGLATGTDYSGRLHVIAVDEAGNESLQSTNTVTGAVTATPSNVGVDVIPTMVRNASSTMPSVSFTVDGSKANRRAWFAVWISTTQDVSDLNFDLAKTLTSTNDGAWTFVQAVSVGSFSGSRLGAILLFRKDSVAGGAHTLTPNISKTGVTLDAVAVGGIVLYGCDLTNVPTVNSENPTSSSGLAQTLTGVLSSSVTLCFSIFSANVIASLGPAADTSQGSSVTGNGDYAAQQHILNTSGSNAFTSSSTTHAALSLEQKAA